MSRSTGSTASLGSGYESDGPHCHNSGDPGRPALSSQASSDDGEQDDSAQPVKPTVPEYNERGDLSDQTIENGPPSSDDSVVAHHTWPSEPRPTLATFPSTSFTTPARSIGYLANRRSAPSLRHCSSAPSMPCPPHNTSASRPPKTPSFIRLSMNSEGKAEIVTKDAASPSPPRSSQIKLPGIGGSSEKVTGAASARSSQRILSGRSRDSRTWEFWCDKEARAELSSAAEKDAHGSAAGAIGLLRTASGRNVLGQLPLKRNLVFQSQGSRAKRMKPDEKQSSLQRSSTSLGRLQSKPGLHKHASPRPKHSRAAGSSLAKGSDSDKENWSPTQDIDSESRRGGLTPRSSNRRSTGHRRLSDVSVSRAGTPAARRPYRRGGHGRGTDPEADEELATFMGGGRKRGNISAEDDLDCIQGLLSLSQGNWR
jgi:hypothetical protein